MMTAGNEFTANELWTLAIAGYAAFVATFVLGWDVCKWLMAGAKIDLTASTGMQLVGGLVPDDKTYISVTAWNIGDQPTTITNLGGLYFESWWCAFITRRKASKAFVIGEPSQVQRIPYRFEVGDQWIGMAIQTDNIVKMARDGYLFLVLYTAKGGRGHRVRLKVREKESADT